jgi:uncharacterized iron-regulated membrane protein
VIESLKPRSRLPHRPPEAKIRMARRLRRVRILHRYVGIPLAVLIVASSVTGLLLGWKKNSTLLQPATERGIAAGLEGWRPLAEVEAAAREALSEHTGLPADRLEIDRLDVRPSHGVVKVLFASGYWEVQVDGATGQVLSMARRHSDWIEQVHDGSIVGDRFKLVSMNVLGLALITLCATGTLLWYAPKLLQRRTGTGRPASNAAPSTPLRAPSATSRRAASQ